MCRVRHVSGDTDFDIIVVGGGPAGSSAAYAAAAGGASVALVEKEGSIAETVRTSGVTWIQSIKEFGIPDDCFNPIRNFAFCSPNNEVSIGGDVAHAAVLDVRKTYRWLAAGAVEAGASLYLRTSIDGVIKDGDDGIAGVSGTGPDGRISLTSKVVIDASGFPSSVSKAMGLVRQWKRFGAGAEYEARVEKVRSDTWWLMVGQMYSPAGYAWIFPTGERTARIGVGIGKPESDVDPTRRLDELIRNGTGPIGGLGRIEPFEFHYGLIPNDGLSRPTVFDNLMLVGDSAGQANPLVLEGIRYAIRFGRMAGTVAADAVRSGDTGKNALCRYEKAWRAAAESKINTARRIQDRWVGLTDAGWDHELDIIRELSPEEFLDFIKADFGLSNMLRLATRHPKLAVRQLFSMARM